MTANEFCRYLTGLDPVPEHHKAEYVQFLKRIRKSG